MTNELPPAGETTSVRSAERASVAAADALADAGCDAIVTTTPYQTRGTWIVPATTDDGDWRVHVDRTGHTKIVRVRA